MKMFHSVFLLLFSASLSWAGYNPLETKLGKREYKDLVVKDEKRSREISIRVYLPTEKKPAAVVLFSHGLGGNREGSAYLGPHWASRGYVVVFLQHPGSDDSIWKDKKVSERMAAMKSAANAQNLLLRVADVPAVLNQLETWNKESGHLLAGRLDTKRIGMSGHSFGAVTTQAVSGQSQPVGRGFADTRIQAAVVMSPSTPRVGNAKKAFADVKMPWMLLTGTNDTSPIAGTDVQSRLDVFPALPAGGKYELVLNKAEHSAFTDRALPGETEKRNPNHHKAILAVTTAFWDAYLHDDAEAKKWLESTEVRKVLEKDDKWQKK